MCILSANTLFCLGALIITISLVTILVRFAGLSRLRHVSSAFFPSSWGDVCLFCRPLRAAFPPGYKVEFLPILHFMKEGGIASLVVGN